MKQKPTKTKKTKQISVGKDFEAEEKMLNEDTEENTSKAAVRQPRELADFWGYEKKSKFPAKTEDEYREYLKGLNKIDIQQECFKNNIVPRDHRDVMTSLLVKEFRRHRAILDAPHIAPKNIQMTPELRKLLEPAMNPLI